MVSSLPCCCVIRECIVKENPDRTTTKLNKILCEHIWKFYSICCGWFRQCGLWKINTRQIHQAAHNKQSVKCLFFLEIKNLECVLQLDRNQVTCLKSNIQMIAIIKKYHLRGHPLSSYANLSEKLALLTPWYAHARLRIRGLEMLVFWKILRTYLMVDP